MGLPAPGGGRQLRREDLPLYATLGAVVLAILLIGAVFLLNSPSTGNSTPVRYALLGSTVVGVGISGVLYDPANHMVYTADEATDSVSVVNATSMQAVATIPTGSASRNLALDPSNGLLFIANDLTSMVSVINTSTETVVANLSNLGCPGPVGGCSNTVGIEFSAAADQLFVLENTAQQLVRVDPATFAVLGTAEIDPNPGGGEGFAIDPSTSTIYFPARGSSALELIGEFNGTTLGYVATPGPFGPTTSFYDPSNGLVYVMLGGMSTDPANQTVVFDPSTGAFVGNITVSRHPDSYAYDPVHRLLYVACSGSANVSVISDLTNQRVASIELGEGSPTGVAVDPATGHVFVGVSSSGYLLEYGTAPPPVTADVPSESSGTFLVARARPLF